MAFIPDYARPAGRRASARLWVVAGLLLGLSGAMLRAALWVAFEIDPSPYSRWDVIGAICFYGSGFAFAAAVAFVAAALVKHFSRAR